MYLHITLKRFYGITFVLLGADDEVEKELDAAWLEVTQLLAAYSSQPEGAPQPLLCNNQSHCTTAASGACASANDDGATAQHAPAGAGEPGTAPGASAGTPTVPPASQQPAHGRVHRPCTTSVALYVLAKGIASQTKQVTVGEGSGADTTADTTAHLSSVVRLLAEHMGVLVQIISMPESAADPTKTADSSGGASTSAATGSAAAGTAGASRPQATTGEAATRTVQPANLAATAAAALLLLRVSVSGAMDILSAGAHAAWKQCMKRLQLLLSCMYQQLTLTIESEFDSFDALRAALQQYNVMGLHAVVGGTEWCVVRP